MKHTLYKRLLLAMIPAALMLASCSEESIVQQAPDTPGTSTIGDIRFEIGISPQTRIATDLSFKSTWQHQDAIGIYAVRRANGKQGTLSATGNYIHNVCLTYNGRTNQWESDTDLWWPGGTEQLDFYAYYPYNAAATDPTRITFNVRTDQSAYFNGRPLYNSTDLLIAKPAGNSESGWSKGETVVLTFSHALAMVQVSIPSTGRGAGPSSEMSVKLNGVRMNSTLNLAATAGSEVQLAEGDNPAQQVKMFRVETDVHHEDIFYHSYTYRALLPPQSISKGGNLFIIANEGDIHQGSGPETNLTLASGTAETFTRSIPNTLHTVKIKAGTSFLMGSPEGEEDRNENEPQHRVTLTKDFRMSKYEITNAQYAEFMNAVGIGETSKWCQGTYKDPMTNLGMGVSFIFINYDFNVMWNGEKWEPAPGKGDYPVGCVTWYGARAYALWAGGDLPTEAQWEYACRAGTTHAYSCGDFDDNGVIDIDDILFYGWFSTNARNYPKEIGKSEPTAWGLYDIHGNVSEWCLDMYDTNYGLTTEELEAGVTDPVTEGDAGNTSTIRTLRGGNYQSPPIDGRSAFRNFYKGSSAQYYMGFRIVFNQ